MRETMRFSISTINLVLSTLWCSHALAANTKPQSSCKIYVASPLAWEGDEPYRADEYAGNHGYRMSKGIDCTDTTSACPNIALEGWVAAQPSLNISTDSADTVFALIERTAHRGTSKLRYKFKSAVSKMHPGYISGDNWQGSRGYMIYSPSWICTEGILSGCTGDIANGTVVKACTPLLDDGKIFGIHHWVEVNETMTEQEMECNPVMTVAAKRGENPVD